MANASQVIQRRRGRVGENCKETNNLQSHPCFSSIEQYGSDRHFQLGNNSLEHYKNVVPRRPLASPSCHLCTEQATLVLSPIISKFISHQNCASPALHVPAPTYHHPCEARIRCGLLCFFDFFAFCYRSCYQLGSIYSHLNLSKWVSLIRRNE